MVPASVSAGTYVEWLESVVDGCRNGQSASQRLAVQAAERIGMGEKQ
jgi:hypothetical protein